MVYKSNAMWRERKGRSELLGQEYIEGSMLKVWLQIKRIFRK